MYKDVRFVFGGVFALSIVSCLIAVVGGCSPVSPETASLRGKTVHDASAEIPERVPSAVVLAQASALPLASVAAANATTPSNTPATEAPTKPHLVRKVDISLQVEDVAAKSTELQNIVSEMGGYLANLTESTRPTTGTEIRLTLRIPAARLDEVMSQLESLGTILSRNLATADVTLQYVDMESRLRNLDKTENRLLAHLERSGEMSDILEVEKEIDRVRSDIETLQGRINGLANQISFATVEVALLSSPRARPVSTPSSINTSQVFSDAVRNLLTFGRGIWFILIWLAVWSPIWVPLALLGRYLYRLQESENSTTK
jgi:hypothetical protein